MLQPNLIWAETDAAYAPAARIDQSSLSGLVDNPVIQSFDLSPDGKTISVLVTAGSQIEAPLWLVTEDIAAKRVISSRGLGGKANVIANFPPQVLYSNNQRFLAVQDSAKIRVFDASTLELLRTISGPSSQPGLVPLYVLGASNSDVFVCAFAPLPQPNYSLHTTPVQLEVVDISSGKQLGEWTSEDVPQSISPDGDLIAVSSSQVQRGVFPLNVFDVHGKKVAELTAGFSFRKNVDQAKPLGRVKGQFVGKQEILLTPDENTDRTGHPSGDGLQLVNIKENEVEVRQTVKPQNYGPKGTIANSADHRTVLVISWYVSAWDLRHEWALPASSPDVLVFGRSAKGLSLETTFPIHGPGLLADWSPRVSSDGSVIAIAQDGGITVLAKNLGSRPQ
jgi:hypothetical protein